MQKNAACSADDTNNYITLISKTNNSITTNMYIHTATEDRWCEQHYLAYTTSLSLSVSQVTSFKIAQHKFNLKQYEFSSYTAHIYLSDSLQKLTRVKLNHILLGLYHSFQVTKSHQMDSAGMISWLLVEMLKLECMSSVISPGIINPAMLLKYYSHVFDCATQRRHNKTRSLIWTFSRTT